jgi:phosphorylase family protein
MEKRIFAPSELILNPDGSVFHLHLKPEQLADRVILVGDPGRVSLIAKNFDTIECEVENREFKTVTGEYRGKRLTVQSTGIGCDNIDIVLNELDALSNIDLDSRQEREMKTQLTLVRIGTCGGLQPYTPIGTFIASVKSIGFDGLLNFYKGRNEICDIEFEQEFKKQINWTLALGNPYVVNSDEELLQKIAGDDMVRGVTISCGGFFGPQGRRLRIPLAIPDLNERIENFEFKGMRITNFEMESSAVAGLSSLMGHRSLTCCMVIANRLVGEANSNYRNTIEQLIERVLERI